MRKQNKKLLTIFLIVIAVGVLIYFGTTKTFFIGSLGGGSMNFYDNYVVPVKAIDSHCTLKSEPVPGSDEVIYLGGIAYPPLNWYSTLQVSSSNQYESQGKYYTIYDLQFNEVNTNNISKEFLFTIPNDGQNYLFPPVSNISGLDTNKQYFLFFNIYYCENNYNPNLPLIKDITNQVISPPINVTNITIVNPPVQPTEITQATKKLIEYVLGIVAFIIIAIIVYIKLRKRR